jgi:hypothetical protein
MASWPELLPVLFNGVSVLICMCTCTHMHAHACTCTHMHAHAHTCTHMHTHARTCMHMHTHACTCTHMHTHACTCTHMHTHACTCTHMHAHACTCTHMHARTHAHTLHPHYIGLRVKWCHDIDLVFHFGRQFGRFCVPWGGSGYWLLWKFISLGGSFPCAPHSSYIWWCVPIIMLTDV